MGSHGETSFPFPPFLLTHKMLIGLQLVGSVVQERKERREEIEFVFFLAQKVLMEIATSAKKMSTVFGRMRAHFRNAAMPGILFMRIHKYTCCASVHLLQASVLFISTCAVRTALPELLRSRRPYCFRLSSA